MHRVAFSVDNIEEALKTAAAHGCYPLRGVATYEDVYKLTYVRGPSGIIVMFAEELRRSRRRSPLRGQSPRDGHLTARPEMVPQGPAGRRHCSVSIGVLPADPCALL